MYLYMYNLLRYGALTLNELGAKASCVAVQCSLKFLFQSEGECVS
jgi:hypothetical protein